MAVRRYKVLFYPHQAVVRFLKESMSGEEKKKVKTKKKFR